MAENEVAEFRARYERHTQFVLDGDLKSALADMVQENLPKVFEGVRTPGKGVSARRIVDVRREGDTWIGDTVYTTPEGLIGLRSIWELRDGVWLAAALANFPVPEEA
ncbi:hypothetical protein EDD29_2827 [Actinocorallia herbida]|uniref:SnoaL-like protein n=1 Tax=Actinocorallia herbida TaxID=58109 RepID=A0A3N1CVL5_9ACTN|nr:hypothetical protein [Actinocorallia herbida]ROO85285.1 hypothetical protein EDD29_2827 [Actinocorallia herbida]